MATGPALRDGSGHQGIDLADNAAIEALRKEMRRGEFEREFEDWEERGGCHFVTEALEGMGGAVRRSGYFISPEPGPDGRHEATDHYWLVMPDGSILDPTYDCVHPGHESVGRFPLGDPRQEWYQEYEAHDLSWHQRHSSIWDEVLDEDGRCDDCEE